MNEGVFKCMMDTLTSVPNSVMPLTSELVQECESLIRDAENSMLSTTTIWQYRFNRSLTVIESWRNSYNSLYKVYHYNLGLVHGLMDNLQKANKRANSLHKHLEESETMRNNCVAKIQSTMQLEFEISKLQKELNTLKRSEQQQSIIKQEDKKIVAELRFKLKNEREQHYDAKQTIKHKTELIILQYKEIQELTETVFDLRSQISTAESDQVKEEESISVQCTEIPPAKSPILNTESLFSFVMPSPRTHTITPSDDILAPIPRTVSGRPIYFPKMTAPCWKCIPDPDEDEAPV